MNPKNDIVTLSCSEKWGFGKQKALYWKIVLHMLMHMYLNTDESIQTPKKHNHFILIIF